MIQQTSYPIHSTLLQYLFELRFATTEQLARLTRHAYGTSRSALRQTARHLSALRQSGKVTQLERRIGGWQRGSTPAIWALTTTGYAEATGQGAVRQRPHLISTTFLEHLLAIAETRVLAQETVASIYGAQLSTQAEPNCWRTYLGPHGEQLTLRPDLQVVVTTAEFRDSYFLEIDRATKNPARVIAKCWQYVRYRRAGTEQELAGVFPAVLWIVPTEHRRNQLRRHIAEAELPPGMFHVLTLDQLPTVIRDGPPSPQPTLGKEEHL
jgi:hypothetical protein